MEIVASTSRIHCDPNQIALAIQQPWIELILQGEKTIEIRSSDTRIRGPIYLYASKRTSSLPFAQSAIRRHELSLEELPRGMLVGSVELWNTHRAGKSDATRACIPHTALREHFARELRNPQRFPNPVPVKSLPFGVWFYPFQRRQ